MNGNGSGRTSAAMETVTPQVAREILAKTKGNPRWTNPDKWVYDPHVSRLAEDMRRGRFYPTAAIVIGPDGGCDDGIHRLTALIRADVTLALPVIRGAPPEARATHDTDRLPRSLAQSANASGMAWLGDKNTAKIVRPMIMGMRTVHSRVGVSRQSDLDFAVEHKDAIAFTAAQFVTAKRGISVAPVQAAIARAWYHVPEALLRRFVRVLYSGISEHAEDVSIIRLRDFLLTEAAAGKGVGVTEIYAKACRALIAVRDKQALRALYAVASDPFPLPGSDDAT